MKWLYERFEARSGGILGDDMGLGKTFQTTTLLAGLFLKNKIQRVLILCPVSVLNSWEREIKSHLKPHVSFCCDVFVFKSLVDLSTVNFLIRFGR